MMVNCFMIHVQMKVKEFIVRTVFELYNYYKKLASSTTHESMTM